MTLYLHETERGREPWLTSDLREHGSRHAGSGWRTCVKHAANTRQTTKIAGLTSKSLRLTKRLCSFLLSALVFASSTITWLTVIGIVMNSLLSMANDSRLQAIIDYALRCDVCATLTQWRGWMPQSRAQHSLPNHAKDCTNAQQLNNSTSFSKFLGIDICYPHVALQQH